MPTTRPTPASPASARAADSPTAAPTANRCGTRRPSSASARIAIPPAWTDVWIAAQGQRPHPGHGPRRARTQAVPLSPALARGARRDEVRPHARVRPGAAADPRAASPPTCARAQLSRERVLATVVALLETTLIRVGNEEYARDQRLVRADDAARPPRRRARRQGALPLPRQERRAAGDRPARRARSRASSSAARTCRARSCSSTSTTTASAARIGSTDVNDYLREVAGAGVHRQGLPHLGRHRARGLRALRRGRAARRQAAQEALRLDRVGQVAERLGNTKAVCRKCYVHPAVFEAFFEGETIAPVRAGAGDRGPAGPARPVGRRACGRAAAPEADRAASGATSRGLSWVAACQIWVTAGPACTVPRRASAPGGGDSSAHTLAHRLNSG